MATKARPLFDPAIVMPAIVESFKKLNPVHMWKNPVMFVTEVGAALTTLDLFFTKDSKSLRGADFALALVHGDLRQLRRSDGRRARQGPGGHAAQEPHQERRAQADARWLDRRRCPPNRFARETSSSSTANELIAADGEIIEGAASVNESAITGESAPVIREAGGDRSAVTGGTTVLSDEIKVRVTANPGESFMDRMIELIEGAKRQKTPNEIALSILLSALTIIFMAVCITMMPFAMFTQTYLSADDYQQGEPGVFGHGAGRAAGLPDSDDDRRTALRHRHRRHRPHGAAQRAGHERQGRRSGGRRGRAAAGQDRHDHAGQPPGDGIHLPPRA